MSDTITLVNNTPRMIPITLDHPAYRNKKSGYRMVTRNFVDESRDGTRRQRPKRLQIPGSMTIPAHGTVEGLELTIIGCTQVRLLEKQGKLTVLRKKVDETPQKSESNSTRPRRTRVVTAQTEQPTVTEENDK